MYGFRPGKFRSTSIKAANSSPVIAGRSRNEFPTGDVIMVPEGTYYIVSNYGDANSTVRSDIRVQAGKLTDIVVTHRAAAITLKLVGDKGGEALANTAWSVLTPGGDVIKEFDRRVSSRHFSGRRIPGHCSQRRPGFRARIQGSHWR